VPEEYEQGISGRMCNAQASGRGEKLSAVANDDVSCRRGCVDRAGDDGDDERRPLVERRAVRRRSC
jgi:hypothetical protein